MAAYRNDTIANSMLALSQKAPLTFTVSGLYFYDGIQNNTVGNKLNVKFLPSDSMIGFDNDVDNEDKKLSGEYLIFSARHILKRERADILLTGVRMTNKKMKNAGPPSYEPGETQPV